MIGHERKKKNKKHYAQLKPKVIIPQRNQIMDFIITDMQITHAVLIFKRLKF